MAGETPSRDPSIEHEPHLGGQPVRPDPSEAKAARNVDRDAQRQALEDHVEHTVWDEPSLAQQLTGPPPADALTWAAWLAYRLERTSWLTTWFVTIGAAIAAGPLAVAGTCGGWMFGARGTLFGLVAVTIVGPVMEEMMKVALPLWIVEKRPFLYRSRRQIAVSVLMSGLAFAAIENVMYLYVYFPEHRATLAPWRWTVCVALHMGCSLVAGLGLMRIWSRSMSRRERPQLAHGAPMLMAAAVIHGGYNAFAVLWDALDRQF